ncbi:MAG: DUF5683 domain-containing protein [Candidatus Marinimicrobia bacterium]|jgi:TM2 domain-containing membrane protein YozV|nr:DUF5683 domain-containing protein [Candidatus Neomarinimicrobiota bacterium]MDD4961345.1 DUF5683 domain-containing protein [Candidatus Neomarinimicrobiota bacterium]MDD5709147.1 DUF5683 domain-containing protein [Candidatus Neomarinimicrobiota bacterium]MDX9778229.1 DUF5683 domain-containing protein [bacterium]
MKRHFLFALLILLTAGELSAESDTLYYESGKMKSPALASGLSLFLPGAGQMYNGKWGKGLFFLGANGALAGTAAFYYIRYAQYKDLYGSGNSITQQSLTIAKRVTWFSAALYVYNIIDAYVDAHLSAFPDERLILQPDPEMPGLRLSLNF